MLGEAEEETVPTVLNTLQSIFPEYAPEVLLQLVRTGVDDLRNLHLVVFSQNHGGLRIEVDDALLTDQELRYDLEQAHWIWYKPKDKHHETSLILTGEGKRALRS